MQKRSDSGLTVGDFAGATLFNPSGWIARWGLACCILTSAFCIWALAYQLPLAQTIHVGGEAALQRRDDDDQFLLGENGSEPADRVDAPEDPRGYRWWWEEVERTGQAPYRWTSGSTTVLVPGAGGGPYLVEILARSGRQGEPAPTVWSSGGAELALSLPDSPRRYRLLARAERSGDLRIELRTQPYLVPGGDPRELGFVLHEVRLSSAGAGLRAPAWATLGWLGLSVATVYGLALGLRLGRRWAWGAAAGAILAVAWCLALYRPALGVFAPALGGLALGCLAMAALAWLALRVVAGERAPAWLEEARPVLALALLAFALRMGGLLHPQALFSDLGFHTNNLFRVTLGGLFFTAGLPSDAGGGQAPYPPGLYLLLVPGELFAGSGAARRLLMQGGTALLDCLAIPLIWVLLRRAGMGVRAAAFAAACYLLPTPALEAFSIGEQANLGGQALALPLLALLGMGVLGREGGRRTTDEGGRLEDDRRRTKAGGRRTRGDDAGEALSAGWLALVSRPSSVVLLATATALALLGHSGVTLSVGATVAAAWLFAWAGRLRGRAGPIDSLSLTIGAGAGLALALLLFYSAPIFLGAIAARGDSGDQGVSLPQVAGDFARALAGLAPPEDRRVPLPPLLGPAAIIGLALILRDRSAQAAPLRALLGAWWAGTLLTLALLVVAGQGVRWAIFLYPALCVGAGVALDALWRWGLPGRLLASACLAVIIVAGLLTWIVTIRDYIHI
jgi:hypothetical protein